MPAGTTAETVLRAVRADGPGALDRLGGEWIIAVRTTDRLTITRDAAGVRTAYWGKHDNRVMVAVEPKGVLAAPGFPRRLDPGALAQFLTFSFVPDERTTLTDLHEIPAGHRLEIDLPSGDTRLVRWFVHEDIDPTADDPAIWVPRTRCVIDDAISDRLPAGEPVAAFLSGGLDSSIAATIAARIRRARGDPPPITMSLHFGADHPNELCYARAVADKAGTTHRELEVRGRDLAPLLRRLVWHLDAPIGDPVTAGNFALARAAADEAQWVLNGEGGDPVFGGPKNLPMLLAHWYPTLDGPHPRESQYLATWRRAGEEVQDLLHPDLRTDVDIERDLISVIRPYFATDRPRHFLNKLMVLNMRLKGAHLILPKVDRMLGAFGLIPLSPLFDRDVIELSLRMPPQAKLHHGVEKWVLKQAYEDVLPRDVITRPKSGMRIPVHSWFQTELRRTARDLLSPRAVRNAGIFSPPRVRDMLRYRTGRDGLRLWMLTTFELWRLLVIEGHQP
jgi:asparagine synthase (glutamine-hydrolysing)